MKQIGRDAGVFGQYMKGATFMIPTPRLLDQVVQMIDLIQMDAALISNRHASKENVSRNVQGKSVP